LLAVLGGNFDLGYTRHVVNQAAARLRLNQSSNWSVPIR
jgi:hypothetical protein